jgi:hypothetical protein
VYELRRGTFRVGIRIAGGKEISLCVLWKEREKEREGKLCLCLERREERKRKVGLES